MLPEVCIRPSTFLPVMMGAEALGLLMGWRKLDHLANLTGALFGEPLPSYTQVHAPAMQDFAHPKQYLHVPRALSESLDAT